MLIQVPKKCGPVLAMTLLELFLQKQLELTEEGADELFDIVIGALEAARDERWRLRTSEPE